MLEKLFDEYLFTGALVFIISFLIVYLVVPNITSVIVRRRLNDIPNNRSSHETPTPTMAGFAFFFTLIFVLFFIQRFDNDQIAINIIAATSLIFMVALKDDLVSVPPRVKIIVELMAISMLLYSGSFNELNFHGFLGLYQLATPLSYSLIIIGMLTIINAYNLIDGIDGLAAIIAIIIFISFGLIFFIDGNLWFYVLICIAFIGMLLAYLRYNLSNKRKIFMGDTGSLIVGFAIGICSIKFLTLEPSSLSSFSFLPENGLFLLLAILWIPIFDMIRVIYIRLKNKKSPFFPDQNHVHHVLINLGLRHHQVAIIIGVFNYLIMILIGTLSIYLNYLQMLGVVIVLFFSLMILFSNLKKKSIQNKV